MKNWKFRIGAMIGATALAGATLAGAIALQDDDASASNTDAHDSAVVYSGGYGLFPVH